MAAVLGGTALRAAAAIVTPDEAAEAHPAQREVAAALNVGGLALYGIAGVDEIGQIVHNIAEIIHGSAPVAQSFDVTDAAHTISTSESVSTVGPSFGLGGLPGRSQANLSPDGSTSRSDLSGGTDAGTTQPTGPPSGSGTPTPPPTRTPGVDTPGTVYLPSPSVDIAPYVPPAGQYAGTSTIPARTYPDSTPGPSGATVVPAPITVRIQDVATAQMREGEDIGPVVAGYGPGAIARRSATQPNRGFVDWIISAPRPVELGTVG